VSKRTESLVRTLEDLTKAQPGLHDAVARVQDQRRGLPGAASYDRAGGRSSDTPDPTGQAITGTASQATPLGRPDPASAELAELDKRLRRSEADALWLLRFVQSNTPHAATPKAKAEAERANELDPECRHCREGADVFEPFRTTTDVGGILPNPVPLCRWHADFTARTKRAATARETDMHHQGRTIRLPA
jgi:hypothetical protein